MNYCTFAHNYPHKCGAIFFEVHLQKQHTFMKRLDEGTYEKNQAIEVSATRLMKTRDQRD